MERSPEIRALIESYYRAAQQGFPDADDRFMSSRDDVIVIGTDPDEWWDGAGYDRAMRAQAQEMGGFIPIYPGEIQAFREGSVGWVVDRPIFRFEGVPEIQARVTAVLHDEAGEWKVVHMHVSVGVPNEEALGQELTI